MTNDAQLLSQYAQSRSESAFRELVDRHIDIVYSAALRKVNGDSHLAQDVTQTVFSELARNAHRLPNGVILPGWLYRHACFTAAKAVRTERRRQAREQTAVAMNASADASETDWEKLAPHLDEALNQLGATDRDAIVLRYFQRLDFRSVGAALGLSEDTAQKRVSRALDKLRALLGNRGVTLTATGLASLLTVEAASAAPAGLAATITTAALSGAAAVAGAGIPILKGLVMTKLQAGTLGLLLVAGTATPLILQHQSVQQLRRQNQALRQQVDELEAFRAEYLATPRPAVDAAELEQLRNEHAELIRLRSEVGLLRGIKTELAQSQARRGEVRTNGSDANDFMEFMRSPALKDMMKTSMGPAIELQYQSFFTEARLSPEQVDGLKALLIKKMMANLDVGQSMMTSSNAAGQAEAVQQAKAAQDAIAEQIHQFLGDPAYAQFQAYEKTLAERTAVNSFKDQLGGNAAPLTPDQEQQLIQAMTEERNNFRFSVDFDQKSHFTGDMASYYTAEKLGHYQQELESLNQNYLARARRILTPDQCGVFEKFLDDQARAQSAVMQMAGKLYGTRAGK